MSVWIMAVLGVAGVWSVGWAAAMERDAHKHEELAWAVAALGKPGSAFRQQKALAILRAQPSAEAAKVLQPLVEQLAQGTLAGVLWLDVLEAAETQAVPELKALVAEWRSQQAAAADVAGRYLECLEGGDAEEGEAVFRKLPQAGCVRCHRVAGEGGGIGPELTGIGGRMDRIHVLESVVAPNAMIVPGFGNVLLELEDGSTVTGVLQWESRTELGVVSVADGTRQTVAVGKVKQRTELPSAMPPGFGEVLTRRQLRDVLEFLCTSTSR